MFLWNRLDDYIYCPHELECTSWYDFVAEYDVADLSSKNESITMRFSSVNHPLYHVRGVIKRKHKATPIVHYYDFPCASAFEGNTVSMSSTPNADMEQYSHTVLCLFVPFRDNQSLQSLEGTSTTPKLQMAIETNKLSGASIVHLQNIQNCHNMMKAG
jgi:hypothetical protein